MPSIYTCEVSYSLLYWCLFVDKIFSIQLVKGAYSPFKMFDRNCRRQSVLFNLTGSALLWTIHLCRSFCDCHHEKCPKLVYVFLLCSIKHKNGWESNKYEREQYTHNALAEYMPITKAVQCHSIHMLSVRKSSGKQGHD